MASLSSKTLMDLYQPASKRLKPTVNPVWKSVTSQSHRDSDVDTNGSPQSSTLSAKQKSRIECNKLLAKSKRNLKICAERVSNCKDYVKLEELLVEETWLEALPGEFQKPYAKNLCQFVGREIGSGAEPIYPPAHMIFNALNSTPFDKVKAVILGQDPYHGPGQAMGLSFSVPEGVKVPSSLVNIFKELKQDLGCSVPSHGNLEKWTVQGVLLLNAVLTVRKHQANSHAKKGWEQFTDAVIKTISQKKEGVVFLLWGNSAQEKSSAGPVVNFIEIQLLPQICEGIVEMTPGADIISTKFTKSVIRSSAALSYVEAQARMDDSRLMDPLTTDLRNMNSLAKKMRARRIERGALTLASAEVKFQIDTETHDPLDIGMYQIREANQMVEEFMLAANVSVAEQILKSFPSCSLLRRHPTPTREMLEPLLRTAGAVGLHLDVSSSKALADSLDHAVGDDPYFNKLIRILATRCMTQAVYFCSGDLSPPEYLHYGLAAPLYTHFTSPIRRYADVIVHRLLAASLGISKLPSVFQDRLQLTSISDNLNYRHRNAQMAGRASVELHTLIYFRNRPTDTEARVVKIRSNGFIVFVPKYGIEGPVYLMPISEKGGGEWYVDEQQQKIKKMDGSLSYSILQTVAIHMEVVEPQPNRPKLQLTLI